MSQRDFDLIVIGAGSGGVRAARVAANHGARVAIAEEFRVGGTCVIRGCVPKKLYVLASRFRDAFDDAAGFGWSVEPPRFDWSRLVAAKEKEITRLEGLYAQNLEKAGVELIRQRAVVEDGATVRFANGEMARTKTILIATGGAPGRLSRSSNSRPCRMGIPSKWKYPGVALWIWHMGCLLTSPSGCTPTCTLVLSAADCGRASAKAAPRTPGSALVRRSTSSKKARIFGLVS